MKEHQETSAHFSEVSAAFSAVDLKEIDKAITLLRRVRETKKNVWIVGNGGSATTASHFAIDLLKVCHIKAISLSDLTASFLAYGNDTGWRNMFKGLSSVLANPYDVLVAISCSGHSRNIVNVADTFSPSNVIVLTGNPEGYLPNDLGINGPESLIVAMSDDITVQEDVHLAVCHSIIKVLRT
ncbi:MAG: SIS domain-containing protein [Anaerolineae bacterium]|nr:SIS domain-containing protein [Anaerolineae bacterium]MDK1117627.1 SIS domain-containing protein [Anaerolineae bacterium]